MGEILPLPPHPSRTRVHSPLRRLTGRRNLQRPYMNPTSRPEVLGSDRHSSLFIFSFEAPPEKVKGTLI